MRHTDFSAVGTDPHADPLSYAIAARDAGVLEMVSEAIAAGRTKLAFQPIVYNKSRSQIAFHEGLMRIVDKTGRVIPAQQFMPAVESTQLGRTIDVQALDLGLIALSRDPDLRLSVNMSARSIGFSRWRRVLDAGLAKDPRIGERLILEITESSAMLMPELVIAFMEEMQDLGIAFALDDFGAGYTAFRYLRDFYFDILKIDGQFIKGLAGHSDNQVLTDALVMIGKHFDMFTIAEGVEDEVDADFLAQTEVDCIQGYITGAPSLTPPIEERAKQKTA